MTDNAKRKDEYLQLVHDLEKLVEGREVDAIIPALTVVLGAVLVESGQDKNGSLEFVISSVITLYELYANAENENE
jgi:hypothetical protein